MRKILLTIYISLTFLISGWAQDRIVTGRVTSLEDGLPIPGVNVIIKGTSTGTATDANGNYSITVSAKSDVLVFTFIGYSNKEEIVGSRSNVDVQLSGDVKQLSEVVVTGYSTQNKREVSGSVSAVKGEQIGNVPLASFDQALQGQVSGVLIQAPSGQPGTAASVRIRGTGSLTGNTQPLYILDGVEITAGDFASLNPSDFENISVLKDAISTSQYGSRGASGVIVITSKRGKSAIPKINYDVQYGFSSPPESKLRLMNSSEKLDYELANGNPFGWSTEEVSALRLINTDWSKVFFQTGKTTNHTLSVSGASDRTSYFISGSYFDQTGTVTNTLLKRYTGRINLETSLNDFIFGINSTFGYSDFTNTTEGNTSIASPLNAIRWTNPYETPYTSEGEYTQMVSGQPNALQELLENNNLRQQLKGVGNVYGQYNIPLVKGLTVKTSWGFDFTSNERSAFVDGTTATGAFTPSQKGSLTRQYGKRFRYTGTSSINYSKQIGEDHNISISLFNEIVKSNSNSFFFTGFGLGGPFENEAGITPGNNTNGFIPQVGGNGSDGFNGESVLFRGGPSALLSYFTMMNYGFKDRYFMSVGVRRDGSSRFGENYRFANFGSIGLSWIITDENFMDGLSSVFDELKFKISYGSAGNQAGIGAFQARELYGRGVYNGVSGLIQNQLANPDLRWERRTTFNTGFEMSTLKGRLNFTIEYYRSLTSELFLDRPLSLTTGYESISSNLGQLQNNGIEISAIANLVKTENFEWSLNANFTYNNNRVKRLFDGQDEIISGITITRPGEAMNSIYVVRYAGVNPENGNAQYITKDGNLTEVYNPDDRVIVGTFEAPYFGGFGTTIKYKGLELSSLFTYVMGNQIFNNDRNNVENPAYLWDNLSAELLTEWRTPGQITRIPRPANQYRSGTTRFVEDGDFLRLRNIILSYSLPGRIISNAKLSSVRLFAQGQNLLTFTKFLGFDPEIANGVNTGSQYPALRTVTFGINVGF